MKGLPGMSTLYAPMAEEIYEDLRAISRLAGLSIAKTAEAMIALSAGRQHVYGAQVKTATKTWKDAQK
jgi:hypothetical protein